MRLLPLVLRCYFASIWESHKAFRLDDLRTTVSLGLHPDPNRIKSHCILEGKGGNSKGERGKQPSLKCMWGIWSFEMHLLRRAIALGGRGWNYLCLYTEPNIQKLGRRRRWNCLRLCNDCKPQNTICFPHYWDFWDQYRSRYSLCSTPCAVSLCFPRAGSGLSAGNWRWDEPGPPGGRGDAGRWVLATLGCPWALPAMLPGRDHPALGQMYDLESSQGHALPKEGITKRWDPSKQVPP